ncbi:hypothetical protein [Bowmanella sp. JS7-9]|uniref:Uncharacterized protein n=1 Tax=Pseudobowmanella zhangzhouensis TaxID=1537679 RepID=A0ABW1XIR8_9ALTE|nr:hypothetical protein [Bowmanella sp. JS7-9]TBX24556.1 hypothetical protein TK45_04610 [Bowmanella sp. JS7-9]
MKQRIQRIVVYLISIIVLTVISIETGSELITQYSMYINGFTGIERHRLEDDMGFGLLLLLGLIPELIIGVTAGIFLGKRINGKLKNT